MHEEVLEGEVDWKIIWETVMDGDRRRIGCES